ncbi:hypothetical protein X801_09784 [Opisthorchis viverrini]|uniref:Uncharacterized protein n=1 Tax=Opisthorchis viverrini TaxID=6198 RepID=A0A1S8WJ05_OPIVI|nr:hypothetical protein X801_09784 [Opisthorchis viverrini]
MHSSGDIAGLFRRICKASPEKSEALAAIDVLTRVLHDSHVSTVQGLHDVLNTAILEMTEADHTYLCVKSACELFQRFITLTISDAPDDFNRCKQVLQERADMFLRKLLCDSLDEGTRFPGKAYSQQIPAAKSLKIIKIAVVDRDSERLRSKRSDLFH